MNTDSLIYRKAELKDRDILLELNQKGFEFEKDLDPLLNMEWTKSQKAREYFDQRIADQDKFTLLAVSENLVVGFITGSIVKPPSFRAIKLIAEIDIIFVEEDWRDKGVGCKLLEEFKKWSRENNCQRIAVEATADNQKACGFYRKVGLVDNVITFEQEI